MSNHENHSAPTRAMTRRCDVVVIGGSAAGLAGALQVARQRRSVIVVDDDTPRNRFADHVHGYLGRENTPPEEMRAVGREEVRSYGGEVLSGRVLDVRREDGLFRVELSGGSALLARRVLVATGLVDILPDIDGVRERWGRSVIHCPFCHGWEVRDERVVQIVTDPATMHVTPLLRHLTDRLTVVLHGVEGVDPEAVRRLEAAGVAVCTSGVARIREDGDAHVVELVDGTRLAADAVLVAAGFRPRIDALAGLHLPATAHASGFGDVLTADGTGRTAVDGVFAAGNVVDPSLQVLAAAAQGSMVGAQIAFSLADEDFAQRGRPSERETEWDDRYREGQLWSGRPNDTLVAEVAALAPARALDVGAGEGGDALWLAAQGWQVTASDVSSRAVSRIAADAQRQHLVVRTWHVDANGWRPYGDETFDLVSLHYGSFARTPEGRGVRSLLDAVAPGGTLLVVSHDTEALHEVSDPAERTRLFDPDAYVGVREFAAALAAAEGWRIAVHETRPRPAGGHHVADIVLRAERIV